MSDDKIKIYPPWYIIGRKIVCWRCETSMPVIALLAPKIDDTEDQVGVLTEIANRVLATQHIKIIYKTFKS
jgi:hypothetical protein